MKYHDPNSRASHPGLLTLSDRKLSLLHPELYSLIRWQIELARNGAMYPVRERGYWIGTIGEHLACGDSRAAVVVSTGPATVAAFSDELDCVALLSFDDRIVAPYRWSIGTRLLTVNTYTSLRDGVASDLTLGPRHLGRYGNFTPFVADLLTDDLEALALRKAEIPDDEWVYAAELGRTLHARRHTKPRDGRPLQAYFPAE